MAAPARTGSPRTEVLRGVLTLAVEVARETAADRPFDVPPPLRPVLRMAKLGPRALAAADRAGDDESFRARIADVVALDELTPAERLWLERPEGWEDDLAALVAGHADATEEGAARRRLEREQRRRARAEEERDRAVGERDRLRAEVQDGRREVERARAAADEAERRASAATADRVGAVHALKHQEVINARTHEQVRVLRVERDAALARGAPEPAPPESSPPEPAAGPPPSAEAAAGPALDRAEVAAAVARSAEGADQLAAALGALARLVGGEPEEGGATRSTATPDDARSSSPAPRHRRAPRRAPRRRAAPLPGGVHDDSTEAAIHLVRLRGAALLVDGYNASKATWPDRPIDEQRQRLVAALDGLEARVGIDTTVVFDGVDDTVVASPSRRVRVRFTAVGTEADDVILDLVDRLPDEQPVLVATDDGRVRVGARARGANVLAISQLRALLG